MKRTTCHLALAIFIAVSPTLLAQEAPASGRLQLAPAAVPPPAVEPEVTLIPEQISVPEKAKPAPAAEKKSKTEESAEDLQMRIHFREARIKALRDEKVQAEYDRAIKAKTDLLKRETMKSYYKLLYARIVKIDPSVAKVAGIREASALHRLEQSRIDPTEPLNPADRMNAFARGE